MKKCKTCSIEKPITDFSEKKYGNDKICRVGECKDCVKLRNKNNYLIRQETLKIVGVSIPNKKYCPKCEIEKFSTEFNSNKSRKDGLSVYCNSCNKNYFKKPERLEYDKQRNQIRKTQENYIEYHKQYRKNNVSKFAEKAYEKYHSHPIQKLKTNFRNRVRKYIHRKRIPSQSILGCSWEMFKEHIESKFTKEMNWDNHGQFGWHLDHIIPLASAKTEDELYKLNHYTNLQPLWWSDNLQKSDKIIEGTNN
jgi:hypothetical protein